MLSSIGSVLLLAFGFGFVIFFHELGHFLAAKWAGVKVEQFAVGFGSAIFSWRKGLGFRKGSTQQAFHERLTQHIEKNHADQLQLKEHVHGPNDEQLARAAVELGISDTEYRLNWIPLGGYVKMLGQDDLKPGAVENDPRAYNNKTIGQRMVIVSAGVIMNVILAAIGFMVIFLVGFQVKPPVVGSVQPGSPAQQAYKIVDGKTVTVGLQPGDRVLYLDNKYQSDWEKIQLNTALLPGGSIPVYVEHADGHTDHLTIVPAKSADSSDFFRLGIMPSYELTGLSKDEELGAPTDLLMPDVTLVGKGDVITQIAGQNVKPNEFWKLPDALQKAAGKPLPITIRSADGKTRIAQVHPHFMENFGSTPINFAGLLMRMQVQSVLPDSPYKGIIKPGDVFVSFSDPAPGGDRAATSTHDELIKWLDLAGQNHHGLTITVLRDGKQTELHDIKPTVHLAPGRYGIGVGLGMDEQHPVVAGTLENSPAAAAKVPAGARITAVNGQSVSTWFDVNNILAKLTIDQPVTLTATVDSETKTYALGKLSAEQIAEVRQNRLIDDLVLHQATYSRKTNNPFIAAAWGVGETRDALLQVYQTVRAMFSQSISINQVSGPVGILAAGYRFAEMGATRLIWFLSIISANLAVMNFLPIPIVDGGLFAFLIIEKLKGGPISPRVQAIAQVVGLAILLSVFLFATYQDVFYRLPFMTGH
jgi:regulator of sigma E protease